MFGKMQKTIVLACFLVLFSISLAFSDNPAYWNLSEGANNVTEYAYDSGSFMLQESYEFTYIYVSAEVKNGDGENEMTAEAYIEVGGWSVHAEASDTEETELMDQGEETNGTGSCNEWYWMIDTRNNEGTGSAWCKWRWDSN